MTGTGIMQRFIDNPIRLSPKPDPTLKLVPAETMTDEMRANIAMLKASDAKFEAQTVSAVDKALSTNEFVHLPPPSGLSLKTAMKIHDMIESKVEQRGDDDPLIRATRGAEVTDSIETYMAWLEERIARG